MMLWSATTLMRFKPRPKRPAPKVWDIANAFDLAAGPAWLLMRMAEEPGQLRRETAFRWLPSNIARIHRDRVAMDRMADQVRQAIGPDAMETTPNEGWRLTPLGRLRVIRALGGEVISHGNA